ncbi:valine--tRNA ligase [Patescibacteria group bacterium]
MSNKEIPKNYEPKKTEDAIYKAWKESGFFNPDNLDGEPYSIMMPPPNVTGILHLGHALENSIMDTMARYQRLQGKKVLLLPGTDHAAVATQAKVEKLLVEQGHANPREEFGREGLLEKIREYAEQSKSTILSQVQKMGTSCDWDRLAYTFDEERSKMVNTVFEKMYNDGLIYRGHKVVNWSVKGQSTCSDDELEHAERVGKLYTFKYSKDFPITIATTRPETKLGDTAVAVNPTDKRYQEFIGKTFTVDIGAARPLGIKVIANDEVDPEFGTGAVGVTPAHSPVDFEMYEVQKAKQDPIELIQVIGEDGKMTSTAGEKYAGLPVLEAREKFVEFLQENNLLEKEEDVTQNVGTSDRFGDVVEALPKTQWFIDVNKKIPGREKSLKELMIAAVKTGHNGDAAQKVTINPDRFEKIYFNWIENLRDWCISRQVWWGHQIPVWYRLKSGKLTRGEIGTLTDHVEIYCGSNPPTPIQEDPDVKDDKSWTQDPDTLDTWFSSGLWTFSTLTEEERKTFHPTNWMQMGHEILFFWMARMILMSTYFMDEIPFKEVYIHGMLRDEKGNKFSKSAGNNLDPIEMIEKYGTDALRLGLITGIAPGNDSKFYEEKVESSRNFVNKLWNISRYILQKESITEEISINKNNLTIADRWITRKMSVLIEDVTKDLDRARFSQASEKIHEFTKNDFADWYLEISKFKDNTSEKNIILLTILKDLLKLWHPFIPFVTETIWKEIEGNDLLLIQKWPKKEYYLDTFDIASQSDEINFEPIVEIIQAVRNIKTENKIEPAKKIKLFINTGSSSIQSFDEIIKTQENLIKSLRTGVEEISYGSTTEKSISKTTSYGITVSIPLEGLIDTEKERAEKEKEVKNLEGYINSLEGKLTNEQFISRAPEEVIAREKESLKKAKSQLSEIEKYLKSL